MEEKKVIEFTPNLNAMYTELELLQMLNKFADYLIELKEGKTSLTANEWFEENRKK